jgi:hypothetical protein
LAHCKPEELNAAARATCPYFFTHGHGTHCHRRARPFAARPDALLIELKTLLVTRR